MYVQQPIPLTVGVNYTIDFNYRVGDNDQVYQICSVRCPDASFQVIDRQTPEMLQGDGQWNLNLFVCHGLRHSSADRSNSSIRALAFEFVAAALMASFHIGKPAFS